VTTADAPRGHERFRRGGLLLTAVVLALDHLTKSLADQLAVALPGVFTAPVMNHEFTLGLAAAPYSITLLLGTVMLAGFGAHCVAGVRSGRLPWWVPPLLVGGALGNLADRILHGAVRDVLLTPWAVVNLADLAVVLGMAVYLGRGVRRGRRAQSRLSAGSALPDNLGGVTPSEPRGGDKS
jgi:lipoprotein signal peptidase